MKTIEMNITEMTTVAELKNLLNTINANIIITFEDEEEKYLFNATNEEFYRYENNFDDDSYYGRYSKKEFKKWLIEMMEL